MRRTRFDELDFAGEAARDFGAAIRCACLLLAPRRGVGRHYRQRDLLAGPELYAVSRSCAVQYCSRGNTGRRARPNPGNSNPQPVGYLFLPGGAAPGLAGA